MAASGYQIRNLGVSGGEDQKQVVVSPADGTIDVERVESDTEVDFRIKTTYDGYETINVASHTVAGYVRAIRVKFNESNKRYRLVCILNGASDNTVVKDFAIYYIKMGYDIGGLDYSYIQEYSRIGNGSYVVLEKISTSEYNILMYMPRDWAAANIGVLKEDKEPNVTIKHYDGNVSIHHPTGTIITAETPTWKNGAPAVWQNIPDVVNPIPGMLGHYYNLDRNLYFYDGYNWHLVYALAQGVASMLATTDAPVTATDGTIYFDTTEQNLKIWRNGGWENILNSVNSAKKVVWTEQDFLVAGALRVAGGFYNNVMQVCTGSGWRTVEASASYIRLGETTAGSPNGTIRLTSSGNLLVRVNGEEKIFFNSDYQLPQVVTFTNYSGETIVANDVDKIIVTASFGATSILDLSSITKEEGKTIEITILSGSIIRVKDGATELDLNGCNESVVKAICLSSVWHYYKVGSITEFT